MGGIGVGAELFLAEGLVLTEVAFEPAHLTVAFERQDMGANAVEEPTVVADDHRASGEVLQRRFEGP